MKNKNSESNSFLPALLRKKWPWVVFGLGIFFLIFLILMPFAIKYSVRELILRNGGDKASIEDIDFNPFTGKLELTDLKVLVGDIHVLKISKAAADISWFPFFQKHIQVQRFSVSDLDIFIEALPEGRWRLGGITATILASSKEDERAEEDGNPWGFGLSELDVKDSRIHLQTADLESTLEIDHLNIARVISWMPETVARGTLSGRINGSSLKGEWEVTPFAKDREATLKLEVLNLSLEPFARVAKNVVNELHGKLTIDADFQLKQAADSSLAIDQNGTIRLQNLRVKTAEIESNLEEMVWIGSLYFDAPGQEDKLRLSAKGQLQSHTFLGVIPRNEISVRHKNLKWDGKFALNRQSETGKIELDGKFGLGGLEVGVATNNFNQEHFLWQGPIQISYQGKTDTLSVAAEGEMSSKGFKTALQQDKLLLENNGLDWRGKFNLEKQQSGREMSLAGSLRAGPFKVNMREKDLEASQKDFTWEGKVFLKLEDEPRLYSLAIDGILNADQLTATLQHKKLNINQDSLTWKGQVQYGSLPKTNDSKPSSSVAIRNLQIGDIQRKHLFFDAAKINLNDMTLNQSQDASLALLQITDLKLFQALSQPASGTEKIAPLIGLKEFVIQNFEVASSGDLKAGSISFDSLKAQIRRDKEGKWNFTKEIAVLMPSSNEYDVTSKNTEKADKSEVSFPRGHASSGKVTIDNITLSGDSTVHFIDQSADPAYQADLNLNTFSLKKLDSTQAKQSSSFEFSGKIGKYTGVDFKGHIKPFADRLTMDLDGKINDLEMPPLSSYTIDATGYRFASGEADIDIDLNIDEGQLSGEGRFEIFKLKFDPLDEETLQQRNIKRTIPLDTAMSLLRDDKGNMKLKVPISGDIADPKFSLGDAINQAVLKASQKATLTYLKYALWPYGTAIAAVEVAMMAADKINGIRLDPIIFHPGSAALNKETREYVTKIAGIMKEHPDSRVQLCGFVAETIDRSALLQNALAKAGAKAGKDPKDAEKDKQGKGIEQPARPPSLTNKDLELLARKRADTVEHILVKEHGIDAGRILICHPQVDKGAAAKPRVDLIF
jgi:hypothetical protein